VDDIHADPRLLRVAATPQEVRAADAVVLLADHREFDFEAITANADFILDCRNRLAGAIVEVL
jgi:UDP-N-acetyl-D-glucosamine dehydrogenase